MNIRFTTFVAACVLLAVNGVSAGLQHDDTSVHRSLERQRSENLVAQAKEASPVLRRLRQEHTQDEAANDGNEQIERRRCKHQPCFRQLGAQVQEASVDVQEAQDATDNDNEATDGNDGNEQIKRRRCKHQPCFRL